MHDTATPTDTAEQTVLTDPDRIRLRRFMAAMPYCADIFRVLPDRLEIEDVLQFLDNLAERLHEVAVEHGQREQELDRIKRDLDGFRRIVGICAEPVQS